MSKTAIVATLLCAVAVIIAYQLVAGPNSYEDCVLKNIGNAETTASAAAVRSACRAKFPQEYLDEDELFGRK